MDHFHKPIESMKSTGLVPVYFNSDVEESIRVLEACYRAGCRVFEFTNRGPSAKKVFESLKQNASNFPDLLLGIGTIFTIQDADDYLDLGADFIVSPAFIPELVQHCQKNNRLMIPGCATVSEVYGATQLGLNLVKIYPAQVLGPSFIQSVKAVLPTIHLMPTGGVEPNEENLRTWFKAGVTCVGMGSKLFVSRADSEKNLSAQVSDVLRVIEKLRYEDR